MSFAELTQTAFGSTNHSGTGDTSFQADAPASIRGSCRSTVNEDVDALRTEIHTLSPSVTPAYKLVRSVFSPGLFESKLTSVQSASDARRRKTMARLS